MDNSKEKIQVEVEATTAEALRQAAEKNGLSKGEVIDQLIAKSLDNDPWDAAMLAPMNFKVLTSKLGQKDLEMAAYYAIMDLTAIAQGDEIMTEDEKKFRQLAKIAAQKAAEYKEKKENK